ncbi:MAG: flagellar hook-associated protein FlgK [Acetobacter papayae]|uniref:flagellar hook-associated protein FlgK n=1 Tax=Acetobacter papayae TaxID=1076592 RepID=UPI0039EBBDEC
MDLISSLSIATSGLNAIEQEYAVTSNNVANSSTSGYVSETATLTSSVVSGQGNGVTVGTTLLNINTALQSSLYSQNATVASYTAISDSLSAVSAVQGSTSSDSGSTATLADELGNVQTALTSLTSSPETSSAQTTVISDADSLVSTIQTLASTYAQQRQTAEDNISSSVSTINTDLTQIGAISEQIVAVKAAGGDTSALENQRLEVMTSLSSEVSVSFTEKSNGDMVVTTADGTQLPTRPDQVGEDDSTVTIPTSTWPLSTTDDTISASSYYSATGSTAGGISGIMLNGKDITTHLTGGTLGGNITLRDQTYPQMQAQLDSFSYTLMNRFANAGMALFTNGTTDTTTDPSDATADAPAGLVGLSSQLSVSSTYTDDPTLLATDGDTTLATTVLSEAFGTSTDDVSGTSSVTGTSLTAPSTGLGPDGSQSTGYTGSQGLVALATALTADQGATISDASSNLTSATSVQTTLQTQVSNVSGVNVDDEMAKVVTLQNSYTANAKLISSIQTMFEALMSAID